MLGPDAVSASTRLPAVQMDTRGQWVQTPVAQQLGLRDGQIVQATAEIRDQRVRLWVKDFFFELPNGWVLKDGDKPFLRVSQNAGSWGFLIQSYPSGQTSTATPASAIGQFKEKILDPQPHPLVAYLGSRLHDLAIAQAQLLGHRCLHPLATGVHLYRG